MPLSPESPATPHPQGVPVSRRRLLEGGAAVLGALALSGSSAARRTRPTRPGRRAATPRSGTGTSTSSRSGPSRRTPPSCRTRTSEQALAADRTRSPYRLEPRRQVEVRLRGPPRRPGHRLLPHRRRRQRLGHHPRPVRLAAARLRPPDLHQHHLPVVGRQRPGRGRAAALRADPLQPGRPVPPDLHRAPRAGRAGGPSCTSRGSSPPTTCGSTASWWATHEDSYTPAEYDITPHLKPGTNQIAVEVYRFSDGDWLEDQDMIRLSGIFRSVYLYSTPAVHLRDFKLDTPLERRLHGRRAVRHRRRARLRRRRRRGRLHRRDRSSTTPTATPSGPGRSSRPSTSRPATAGEDVTVRATKAVPAPRTVVRRAAEPLHRRAAAARPGRQGDRDAVAPGGPARVRAQGRADADQRQARLLPRHEPARDAPRPRHGAHPRATWSRTSRSSSG